jgi:hypothetical protein
MQSAAMRRSGAGDVGGRRIMEFMESYAEPATMQSEAIRWGYHPLAGGAALND